MEGAISGFSSGSWRQSLRRFWPACRSGYNSWKQLQQSVLKQHAEIAGSIANHSGTIRAQPQVRTDASRRLSLVLSGHRRSRFGVSRIEIFAIVTIGALGMQLLVCAIQPSREIARQACCLDNLRKIGVAISSYHEVHQQLPPAAFWGWDISPFDADSGAVDANWAVLLLPHLGEYRLYGSFAWNAPISDRKNADLRTTELAVMKCPSDAYNRSDSPYFRNFEPGRKVHPKIYARGNYAINGGTHARCQHPGHSGMPCASGYHDENRGTKTRTGPVYRRWGIGIAGFNKSFSFDDFVNGLSKTVAVDEIRAGIHPLDPRGVWSVGLVGMSVTWAHGIHGDAVGPNNPTPDSDDIHGCNLLHDVVGAEKLLAECMGCCDHCTGGNEQAGARSMHPGGVHVLMADGSAGFVSDGVDISIWHVMHSRENPQPFELPF